MSVKAPIAIFDSGVGGLTVLKALMQLMPHEDFVYFGDTARVPYGNKSSETVIRYSEEIVHFLFDFEVKMLVVACNTASAYVAESLHKNSPVPVVDVVEPCIHAATTLKDDAHIAVLATKSTVNSGVYQKKLLEKCPQVKVLAIPCPLFVPLVEENFLRHPSAKSIVQTYLEPLQEDPPDALVLACTHYPLLKPLIQEVVGPHVQIIDSATCCAADVEAQLVNLGIQNDKDTPGSIRYFVSDAPKSFQSLAQQLLGMKVTDIDVVDSASLQGLYA